MIIYSLHLVFTGSKLYLSRYWQEYSARHSYSLQYLVGLAMRLYMQLPRDMEGSKKLVIPDI